MGKRDGDRCVYRVSEAEAMKIQCVYISLTCLKNNVCRRYTGLGQWLLGHTNKFSKDRHTPFTPTSISAAYLST